MTLISIIIIIFFLQSQIKHFRLKSGEEIDWLGWGMRANGGHSAAIEAPGCGGRCCA